MKQVLSMDVVRWAWDVHALIPYKVHPYLHMNAVRRIVYAVSSELVHWSPFLDEQSTAEYSIHLMHPSIQSSTAYMLYIHTYIHVRTYVDYASLEWWMSVRSKIQHIPFIIERRLAAVKNLLEEVEEGAMMVVQARWVKSIMYGMERDLLLDTGSCYLLRCWRGVSFFLLMYCVGYGVLRQYSTE